MIQTRLKSILRLNIRGEGLTIFNQSIKDTDVIIADEDTKVEFIDVNKLNKVVEDYRIFFINDDFIDVEASEFVLGENVLCGYIDNDGEKEIIAIFKNEHIKGYLKL